MRRDLQAGGLRRLQRGQQHHGGSCPAAARRRPRPHILGRVRGRRGQAGCHGGPKGWGSNIKTPAVPDRAAGACILNPPRLKSVCVCVCVCAPAWLEEPSVAQSACLALHAAHWCCDPWPVSPIPSQRARSRTQVNAISATPPRRQPLPPSPPATLPLHLQPARVQLREGRRHQLGKVSPLQRPRVVAQESGQLGGGVYDAAPGGVPAEGLGFRV